MAVNDTSRTLWMGDLEPYMDEFFILQAFENMGEPAMQVKMINNKYTGTGEDDDFQKIYGQEREISREVGQMYPELRLPAGYCFVDFTDGDTAQRAQLRLNGKIIPNSQPPHRFKLNSNQIRDCPKKEFSLFVGELSEEVDDYALFRAFVKKYPSCHTAKVVLDSRGMSKGYGFVRFSEETEQQKALIEMQHTIGLGRKPMRVSLATPKKTNYNESGGGAAVNNMAASYQNKAYQEYCQQYYQQYYNQYYAASQQVAQAPPAQSYYNMNDDQNALEEPELEIDVDKYNREYMAQSEEIFDVLEDSRWHPMDQWNSTVPATAR
ncbi:tRNA selenocysteine 1-associated protein 1-like isoform X2 [Mercenaria mercenaria]|uniref:tRNA selenocysteine 1-associated protein 1-like isoform X2 n=1 Tax=Mercenaria mercenaria TaxID=6596 RepID=UPI00234EC8B1|nr:tRNA selenocysteine 1-associated protein 1-like isoform X2 [Mercenaria mercenaria]